MADRVLGGYLTVFSPDRSEIYGELTDGVWEEMRAGGVGSRVITAVASDGTFDEIRRLIDAGIDQVAFDFEASGSVYQGLATLLRPENDGTPGGARIRLETDEIPVATSRAEML